MKHFIIGVLLFIISCKSHTTTMSLGGIYTASYEHEFGKTNDTLVLSKANDGNNLYKIIRHSGVVKKLQDKEFPKEIITEKWIVKFDPEEHTLTELRTGKVLVWNRQSRSLFLGDREYKKTD